MTIVSGSPSVSYSSPGLGSSYRQLFIPSIWFPIAPVIQSQYLVPHSTSYSIPVFGSPQRQLFNARIIKLPLWQTFTARELQHSSAFLIGWLGGRISRYFLFVRGVFAVGQFAVGQFAIGQFTVRKNVSFGQVRLGQVKLDQVRFFFLTVNCPTAKNPRPEVQYTP